VGGQGNGGLGVAPRARCALITATC
jgi:hypothetical protein